MVMREALAQAVIGILIGLPLPFAVTRAVSSQLYGISPTDPGNAAAVALMLVASVGMAASIRALRASRVDPIRALRHD